MNLQSEFLSLYGKFTNLASLENKDRPLFLAHYTSLDVLEKIVQNEELWFSNPLFMNDHEEVLFVLNRGISIIRNLHNNKKFIEAVRGDENCRKIVRYFNSYVSDFENRYLFDVYIFCLSEYDIDRQPDGRLSMWRGYGADGHGAALVFKTDFITVSPESPFLIGKVQYATAEERNQWIENTISECAEVATRYDATKDVIRELSYHMFYLLLLYSLTSKHPGFAEEQEWRVVYLPDRDSNGLFSDQKTYLRRGNRIEPKLKFAIKPLPIESEAAWSFDSILYRIVLGPSHASLLALNSAQRMLQALGRPKFAQKVWVSEIPYRATTSVYT
jgi:hypothetical protein